MRLVDYCQFESRFLWSEKEWDSFRSQISRLCSAIRDYHTDFYSPDNWSYISFIGFFLSYQELKGKPKKAQQKVIIVVLDYQCRRKRDKVYSRYIFLGKKTKQIDWAFGAFFSDWSGSIIPQWSFKYQIFLSLSFSFVCMKMFDTGKLCFGSETGTH